MFDIGFAELIVIGVVALLVIGPERLPETIRTASLWLNRIRRGFNEIKQEVQQELHNDSVMQELRKTGEQLKTDTAAIGNDLKDAADSAKSPASQKIQPNNPQQNNAEKSAE
jgi:sec-independent protein translocase protein TatB